MPATDVDVVVVGAGLSGLSAARQLEASGVSFVVLEAGDRVGGRTCSRQVGDAIFDLGAQWIGPGHDRVYALARDLGVRTFPTRLEGRKILDVGSRGVRTYNGFVPPIGALNLLDLTRAAIRLERLRRRIPLGAPQRAPLARALDQMTIEDWKREHVRTQAARDVLEVVVRSIFAIDSSDTSMLHFLFYVNAGNGLLTLTSAKGGAQQDRFVRGSQELSLCIAKGLGDRIVLGAPVTGIAQHQGQIAVRTRSESYSASWVIVTVPPPLIQNIEMDPPLPGDHACLYEQMPMRGSLKFVVAYERAFWKDRGLSGEVLSTNTPFSVVFDNTSHDGGQPALVGFIRGRAGDEIGARPPLERRRFVVEGLTRFYGPKAGHPSDYVDKYWPSEQWVGGCHATFQLGAWTQHGSALRRPVGRIIWAGTERAEAWHGYMEGAVRSGERAARDVQNRL